jgi:hypothetical protein
MQIEDLIRQAVKTNRSEVLFGFRDFEKYSDAFRVAQTRANIEKMDFGIEPASPIAYCDLAPRPIGKKLPKAKYRVFLLPSVRYRQGNEARCQVVEPEVMTNKEMEARGHIYHENVVARKRRGSKVLEDVKDTEGNMTTKERTVRHSDLWLPCE